MKNCDKMESAVKAEIFWSFLKTISLGLFIVCLMTCVHVYFQIHDIFLPDIVFGINIFLWCAYILFKIEADTHKIKNRNNQK